MDLRFLMDVRGGISDFDYPEYGLLPLKGIFTANDIDKANNTKLPHNGICRVLKRGAASGTTVGTLSKFRSFVRSKYANEHLESLELPILPHEHYFFSRKGDSGSIIVTPDGRFVGLLTGGAVDKESGVNITYAIPFEWVWNLVREEFPNAELDFDNLRQNQGAQF